MSWFNTIVVFLIVWWTVIFAVLPLWVRVPEQPDAGHATSAPEHPRLGYKLILTTVIASIITLIIWLLVDAEVFSFREWAATL